MSEIKFRRLEAVLLFGEIVLVLAFGKYGCAVGEVIGVHDSGSVAFTITPKDAN